MGTSKTESGRLQVGIFFTGLGTGEGEGSVPPGRLGTLQMVCVGAAAHLGQEFRSSAGAS